MQPDADGHRCAVLIVEDEADLAEMLRLALSGEGFDVSVAHDGWTALDCLRSTPCTCAIVLDLGLPDMDGPRFRAAQRRDRSLGWIPVIVVSGAVDAADRARDLDADLFLRKPLDPAQVRDAVHQLTARHLARATEERGRRNASHDVPGTSSV